jgi:hypothetical protein
MRAGGGDGGDVKLGEAREGEAAREKGGVRCESRERKRERER